MGVSIELSSLLIDTLIFSISKYAFKYFKKLRSRLIAYKIKILKIY